MIPTPMRPLCRLEDIPDGEARGFPPTAGGFTGLFAIRRGTTVFAYVNSCPHIGVPLDWAPHRFLTRDGQRIICATHGAEFRISDGLCTHGPCLGERLEQVMIDIEDGVVRVPADAGL
ncbi:MAG: Rieske (2Fe-2S) protein [Acetobacteraceae bacterium]|nr:Rieske (2Fe-2S) protein [Acetobacteraceae bacterium]